MAAAEPIQRRAFARLGLLGNPSDGYGGKCLSVAVANFEAEVTLTPGGQGIAFLPNPLCDPTHFGGLEQLSRHIVDNGYYGGLRLLMATCRTFQDHCQRNRLELPARLGSFSLGYETSVPRQLGLSGSSAIACATLSCLLAHFGLEEAVPPEERPALVLRAEEELGITAGLQDRVVQVYGGAVYMDFERCAEAGRGRYLSLDPASLPPLYLIHSQGPPGKDSGSVHAVVRRRWLEGDAAVRSAMPSLAELALQGKAALEARDCQSLASLMAQNFALRRQVFGDEALGPTNLAMVALAASVGASAKLCGSGGAVVAVCPEGAEQEQRLAEACEEAGFVCERVRVAPASFAINDFD